MVYLSGAYSGAIDSNIQKARMIAIELWEKGFVVICPHLNTYHFERDCKLQYDEYIKGDLEILSRCEAIIMIPGWELSIGACHEKEFAKYLQMPIYYYPELPELRERMTDEQEAHLQQIINHRIRRLEKKYPRGQREHGGNLFNKPVLEMLLEEIDDLDVYAPTLEAQIKKSISRLDSDEPEDAKNILIYGNPDGRKEDGD